MAEDIASFTPAHQGWQNRTLYFSLTPPHGFYITPADDTAPTGWGKPFNDEVTGEPINYPLGSSGGTDNGRLIYGKDLDSVKVRRGYPYAAAGVYNASTDGSTGTEGVTYSQYEVFIRGKRYPATHFGMRSASGISTYVNSSPPFSSSSGIAGPASGGTFSTLREHTLRLHVDWDIVLVYVMTDTEGKKWVYIATYCATSVAPVSEQGLTIHRMPYSGGDTETVAFLPYTVFFPGSDGISESESSTRYISTGPAVLGSLFYKSNCSPEGKGYLCMSERVFLVDMLTGAVVDESAEGLQWRGFRDDGSTSSVYETRTYLVPVSTFWVEPYSPGLVWGYVESTYPEPATWSITSDFVTASAQATVSGSIISRKLIDEENAEEWVNGTFSPEGLVMVSDTLETAYTGPSYRAISLDPLAMQYVLVLPGTPATLSLRNALSEELISCPDFRKETLDAVPPTQDGAEAQLPNLFFLDRGFASIYSVSDTDLGIMVCAKRYAAGVSWSTITKAEYLDSFTYTAFFGEGDSALQKVGVEEDGYTVHAPGII
jgi:hypothetical protein